MSEDLEPTLMPFHFRLPWACRGLPGIPRAMRSMSVKSPQLPDRNAPSKHKGRGRMTQTFALRQWPFTGLVLVQNSSQAHVGKSILVKGLVQQKNVGVISCS